MYRIELYEDKNGYSEIKSYIKGLEESDSKNDRIKVNKIRKYMQLLEIYGLTLNEPYIKKSDSNIWELRPLKDRFIFAYYSGRKFIILSHFVKKTQKTPRYEIERAKRLLEDYRRKEKYE